MRIRPVQSVFAIVLTAFAMNVAAESVSPKDDTTVTLQDLVDEIKGDGVTITNPVFTGFNAQAGLFSGYNFLFNNRIDQGVIISSGTATDVIGANTVGNRTTDFPGGSTNDPDLGNGVFDTVKLTMDVVPDENTLIIDYVFGSEEYDEYVNSGFNDNIRVLVGGANCALTADGQEVSIDSVNNGTNNFLYTDNTPQAVVTQMDGFTARISCRFTVTPGLPVSVMIGLADVLDGQWDSWAFIKAQSLRSEPSDEFGDAPDTYKTLSASGGAAHTIVEGVYLGTVPSGDDDGFADGFDDSLGNAADDSSDDGVLTFPNLDADVDTSYSITVNATTINAKDASIIGWIDFDRDGVFQPDEASNITTLTQPAYETDVTLTWPAIRTSGPDVAMGTTFARLRMVNTDEAINSADAAGIMLSGEVEDYRLEITGTGDITPPNIQIDALSTADLSNQSAYPVTGTCSAGDNNVSVSVAGVLPGQSVLCSGGGTWTASFDVSGIADGIGVIVVNASQQDAIGNLGNATPATADKDVLVPSVDIQGEPVIANTSVAFTVTVQFSEDVTGFAVGEITVNNGSASNLVEVDANTYTADITPDGGGNVSINVAANVAQDIFNNNNTAAPQATVPLNGSPSGIFTIGAIADTNINENSVYTSVTPVITGEPDGIITYTLGGADAGLFTIDGVTGVVSMMARDFETPADAGVNNIYDLIITATDGNANTDTEAWSVTVDDVLEVASFTIDAIADTNVDENVAYTSVTPNLSGASPIGTITYTLGGTDAGLFTINSGTGVVSMVARNFEVPADAGTNNVYDLTITATDSDGNNDTEAWSVTVDDVVEVAVFTIDAIANTNVNENSVYTGIIPNLSGALPIGVVVYTLGGTDSGLFTINSGTGVVSMIARNFESPVDAGANNVYDLTITVTDSDGNNDTEAWSVTVQDVVEVAAFTIDAIADTTVDENTIYTGVTPSLSGAAPIGTLTYTLGGTDSGLFTINGTSGVVSMIARDFEAPADAGNDNVYDLTITATDSDGNNDTEAWNVSVQNVVEVVAFTIDAIADTTVDENAIYTGVTPGLSGAAPIGTLTYTLGGTDSGLFTINSANGIVSMIARDFESPADSGVNNVYDLTITTTDSDGNNDTEAWSVTVQDVVEVAAFTIDAIADTTVDENAIYTGVTPSLSGAAPIGTLTYTLGGTDSGLFTINGTSGVVSMIARDFEAPADAGNNNVYDLTITATDSDGNNDTEAWNVSVQNVVEVAAFTIDAIADTTVDENAIYTGVTPGLSGAAPIGTLTYTLGGTDAGLFTINGTSGVVSMIARDFELPVDAGSNNIYDLSITATDSDGNADSEAWSVSVQNVVEVAAFTIDAIADTTVDENTIYTGVTPSLSGAAPIGTLTYTLGGTDSALFTINAANGVVSMIARDFELPVDAGSNNIYDLSITATDSDGNADSEVWSVSVQNVVEVAAFTIDAIADTTVDENTIYTGVTPSLSGAAPIGTLTYTLGDTDAGLFTINGTSGVVSMIARDFEAPADAGADNVYDLTITATDSDGNNDTEAWNVSVQNVVEVAAFTIDAIADTTVDENAIYTGVTPNLSGAAPIGTLTYTLGGTDSGLFTINGTSGVVSMIARDFEAPADAGADNVYDLTITATDSDGNNDTEAWNVSVQNVVEVAAFTIDAIADTTVDENAIYTGVTPSLSGAAPIGTLTYTLGGTDSGLFTINSANGIVSMIARDFESPADSGVNNVYDLTITTTDSDGNNDTEAWSVTVQDVVEVAAFTIDAIADTTVDENTIYTGVTPSLSGAAPIGTLTYTLGGTDAGLFTINGTSGVVSMIARDFELPVDAGSNNIYDLSITATDSDGNADNEAWNVSVQNVVEVAAFTIDAIADTTVDENTIYTGVTPSLSGAAPIGTLTYTLGGTDAGLFTINGTSGVVSMIARDFEAPADAGADNVYDLTITATDSDGNNDTEAWSVTVQNVVEVAAFTIDAIADTTVDENTIYTGVTPSLSGAAPIGTLTYTLGGADAGLFTINGTSGVVSMIARDFEAPADAGADNVYDLTITATDSDGNNDTEAWNVSVQNVVEVAAFTIDAIADTTVDENTIYTGVTPSLSGAAPIGTLTYTLGGTDAGLFTINGTSGVVSMIARDFELPVDAGSNNIYDLSITATDSDGNADNEAWNVSVQNVVEVAAFTIDAIADTTVDENTIYTGVTPSLSGAAPIGTLTYTLGGTDAGLFTINGTSGVVSMIARDFEAPADAGNDNVYDLTITATDSDGNNDTEAWNVSVQNVVEAAVFTIDAVADVNINENTPYTSVTPNITGTPIGSITYSLGGTDASDFTIDGGTGVVSMVARDFENPADANADNVYDLTITVTDADGNSDSEDWTVTVDDVVEAASFTIDAIADVNTNENTPYTSVTPNITGTPIGSITYTLGGTDAFDFTISGGTGVVSMVARDYENPADANTNNVYELTITVTDADGNSDSEDWTVTIDDVTETASFTIDAIADTTVDENAIYTGVTPSLSGAAPVGTLTYTLGGTDSALFTINAANGVVSMIARDFEAPADAGADNVYDLTIAVTDSDGNNDTEAWSVTVQDMVETASFTIDAIADTTVDENAIYTGVTPSLSGAAPVGTLTYTLGGTDSALFTINAANGVVSMIARDFEAPADAGNDNVYDLTIAVTDSDGNNDTEAWSVTVQDMVETASFTIDAIADTTVDENAIYTGVTPSLSGAAPVGTLTYTLGGTDSALFTINAANGVVSMIARDFEAPADAGNDNVYDLTITATDSDGNNDSEAWSVSVQNVVEAAVFTIDAIADVNISENTPYTSVTPNITGITIGSVTYILGGADSALFTINAANGVVSMVARDFENPADANTDNIYELTITVTDADGNSDSEDWTVTVDDVVETASFTIDAIADVNINENAPYTSVTPNITGTPIGSVTYTLGGADSALFTINGTTGVVSMVARDFENAADANTNNVYEVTITATDDDGNVDSEDWTVTVDDVVEADVILPVITLSGASPITIERGLGYFDIGATATDNIDGNITATIVTVNPVDSDTAGTYTVTYDVTDAAGNAAIQVTRTVIVEDTVAPGVSILNQPASVNSLDVFNVTFQFTEVVSGFVITDISVLNATVSNFVNVGGVGDSYIADITPTGAGDVTVGVNSNVAQDASTNSNTAAVSVVTTFDSMPPDVQVTGAPDVNIANQSAVIISGTCMVGDGDVSVYLTIGPLPIFVTTACVPGDTWSTSFDLSTVTDGIDHIDIGAQQTDAAGNTGSAPIVMISKDTVRPNVQIQNVPAFVNTDEFVINIVFDEDVSGFGSDDISVTNGTVNVASFSVVDAHTYTVGIAANGVGDVTLNVASNVAKDLVGNDNNAAAPVIAVFDITAPVVTITTASVVNAANDDSYTVGGDCDIGDGDITVSIAGATPAIRDVACTAGSWTAVFNVVAIADGSNAVTVNASQTDAAGNTGDAVAVQVDKDVLITVPTVNLLVTNSATPVISGTADTDTSNEIIFAGATYTVIAVAGDLWSLDTAVETPDSGTFALVNGANEVVVTSTDNAGNSAVDVNSNEITLTLDDDNDGIPNYVECPSGPPYDNSCTDTDGDGTPDFQEVDSDNDGIPDVSEAGLDTANPIDSDGDGIPDYRDVDSDNDGIDDSVEGVIDTDGDGIPDYVDVGVTGDSDGDGIPDTVECTAYPNCPDTDNDGSPDYLETDSDNDGIDDAVEAGVDPTAPIDTDADGTSDYKDTDSDDEGAADSVEGIIDIDGDSIPDYVDAATAGPGAGDSDGDGIADNIECELYPLCADSDADGTPDYMETDSDNDGIPDVVETGTANNDADNDGIDDSLDVDITGGLDLDNDGVDDRLPLDTDGDGTPDYQDADSDGDGINDIAEGVIDTDADGIPDYLDAANGDASGADITGSGDSDGDGISDVNECPAGIPCSDVDADGTPDYMDANAVDGPLADFDNDGMPNYLDPDDDNDNIPDVVEDPDFDADNNPATNPLDSDQDGTPDYMDSDSDDDGLSDAIESGASGNDSDGDNIDDSYDIDITGGADANNDGVDDAVMPLDSDADNLPDYLDTVFDGDRSTIDTDNDGISDEVECPVFPTDCPDTDADGTPDFLETDSDGDGLDDSDEAGLLVSGILLDTDGDGTPDYQDLDSDGDGVDDAIEGLSADADGDGIPDALDADSSGTAFGGDSDNDGVADMDECNSYPGCNDSNNDGTPDYMDASVSPYDQAAVINTGLNGVGSNGPWSLLFIITAFVLRRKAIQRN